MALRGTLKDFALPDIFQLIGMQRKSGLLTLKGERETVTVIFDNGMVVLADSTVRRLDDLLGNVLVRQGKLKKSDLQEALTKQKVSMQRLGYILTSQGYIDADALKDALAEQVQQIVFRVFRWKDGQYDFDPDNLPDYDRRQVTPVSTDHILMEGIRRVDEWPIIEKRIPSLRMVFRRLVRPSQVRVSKEGSGGGASLEAAFEGLGAGESPDSPRASAGGVVLSEPEAQIFNLLDGHRSIAVIVDKTGLSDFDVSRTLFDLLERNLVEPVGHQRSEVREHEPAAAAPRSSGVGTALLVIVLAATMAGLFFSYSTPFRVPSGAGLLPAVAEDAARAATLARLERVDSAIRTYHLSFRDYPSSLEDLLNASPPLVSAEDLSDTEGVPFLYDRTAERVALAAVSAAGEPYVVFVHEIVGGGAGIVDPSQP